MSVWKARASFAVLLLLYACWFYYLPFAVYYLLSTVWVLVLGISQSIICYLLFAICFLLFTFRCMTFACCFYDQLIFKWVIWKIWASFAVCFCFQLFAFCCMLFRFCYLQKASSNSKKQIAKSKKQTTNSKKQKANDAQAFHASLAIWAIKYHFDINWHIKSTWQILQA